MELSGSLGKCRSARADTGDPLYVMCLLRCASDCECSKQRAGAGTGRSVHAARSMERDRYPHKIGRAAMLARGAGHDTRRSLSLKQRARSVMVGANGLSGQPSSKRKGPERFLFRPR